MVHTEPGYQLEGKGKEENCFFLNQPIHAGHERHRNSRPGPQNFDKPRNPYKIAKGRVESSKKGRVTRPPQKREDFPSAEAS